MDRHPCRSDLRFAFAASRPCGGLCVRGLEGEVCEGLRRGVGQGDEPGPLRARLISAERFRGLLERSRNPASGDQGRTEATQSYEACGNMEAGWSHRQEIRAAQAAWCPP